MTQDSPALIVVSNRLPVVLRRRRDRWRVEAAVGGLVTALIPVLESLGGTWVGWPGTTAGNEATRQDALDAFTRERGYRFATVDLGPEEEKNFYRGFCNEIIWPLFHDLFGNCVFEPDYWHSYLEANRRFAESAASHAGPRDVIWVQDYHLMNVARELRALGLDNRIGFFLHIPFPGPDIFMKLPWRTQIMEALLAFNQLGFQTPRDQSNFLACMDRLVGPVDQVLDVSGLCLRPRQVSAGTSHRATMPHEVVAGSFPISIDYDSFAARAASETVADLARVIRSELKDRHVFLGVDRLDYSKGLPQKLAAFRYALTCYPELHRQVTLVQHVVPSRESVPDYRRQRLQIEGLVGEINGRFGEPGWTPIHYYYHTLSADELCAWYRCSNTVLITSVKDGMNLVAKEYCACNVDGLGVVVLSEFAGAAGELERGALLINPFDVEGVARSIHHAYAMEDEERAARMEVMREIVREHNVHRWADLCLAASSQGRCRPRPAPAREAVGTSAGSPTALPSPRGAPPPG